MQTVILDFDGVIHSYESGWSGADVVIDPPTSAPPEPNQARAAAEHEHEPAHEHEPQALAPVIRRYAPGERSIRQQIARIREAGYRVVVVSTRCYQAGGIEAIKAWLERYGIIVDDVTGEKPPAIVTIDDRAICFDPAVHLAAPGALLSAIRAFEPWWSQGHTHPPSPKPRSAESQGRAAVESARARGRCAAKAAVPEPECLEPKPTSHPREERNESTT